MNKQALLIAAVILTVITALVHLGLGGGMMAMMGGGGPRGGGPARFAPADGQPLPNGQSPADGQAPPDGAGPRPAGPGGMMGALPVVFLLNGVGYLALLAALTLPVPYFKDHPALAHWLLIGFAALTFGLYFVMNPLAMFLRNPIAIVTKVAELLLIVFVFLHLQSVQNSAASPPTPAAA